MTSRKQKLVGGGHKGRRMKKSKNKDTSNKRIFSMMKHSKEEVDSKRAGRRDKKKSDSKDSGLIQLTNLLKEEGFEIDGGYLVYRGGSFLYSRNGRKLTVYVGNLEGNFYMGSLNFSENLRRFLGGRLGYGSETV